MRAVNFHSRSSRTQRFALLLSLLLAGAAWAAPLPPPDVPPQSNLPERSDLFEDGAGNAKAAPLPWRQLNPAQRAMLAPLQSQWDQLPPHRQRRMAAHAEHWMQLPPERREQMQQHLARWARMTPEQRHDAARGERAFSAMPQADRQRVLDAYQRFQSLNPEQRKALMRRFREQRAARRGMHPPADMHAPKRSSPPQR